jgi:hydroxymethylpyrimidine pyrophosphatase-like HAD family hydrolase
MRLLACDLDGTIVRSDGTISARTLAVLTACQGAGVHVVFVTGRPARWMQPVIDATGHRGLAICGNGAVVLDLADGGLVRVDALPIPVVADLAGRLRRHVDGAAFALETLTGYQHEPDFPPRWTPPSDTVIAPLAELLDAGPVVTKLLCRQPAGPERLDADALLATARSLLAGIAEPVHSDRDDALLEIAALGVTKASALARLAGDLGVPAHDVVAFGDMPNDAPMLAWAGSGYAMADGHPEAIAAASGQAPPCHQDGVAQVVEELLAARARPARPSSRDDDRSAGSRTR